MISEAARTRQEKKAQEALLLWLTLVQREYGPHAKVDWLGLKSNFIKTVSPQFTETFRLGGRGALAELLKKKPGAISVLDDRGFDPDSMIDGTAWGESNASGLVNGLVSNIQGAMHNVSSSGHGDGGGHGVDTHGGAAVHHTTAADWKAALEAQCSPSRAEGIGVTETTRSISAGEEDFIDQIGQYDIATVPTWRTKRDVIVCPRCREVADQPCKEVGYPPMHPNCRCRTELVTSGKWE